MYFNNIDNVNNDDYDDNENNERTEKYQWSLFNKYLLEYWASFRKMHGNKIPLNS